MWPVSEATISIHANIELSRSNVIVMIAENIFDYPQFSVIFNGT